MKEYNIVIVNQNGDKRPLYERIVVRKLTFGEAATVAYIHRTKRGHEWEIESVSLNKG